jgi:hypothetical protein
MRSVGVIRQLARYPVKSMQGEALLSAALTLQGFAEDRRYAFVQAASRSSFPWLTARELPELLYYQTSVERAGSPEVSVTVATPRGENWAIGSDELRRALEALSGRPLFLMFVAPASRRLFCFAVAFVAAPFTGAILVLNLCSGARQRTNHSEADSTPDSKAKTKADSKAKAGAREGRRYKSESKRTTFPTCSIGQRDRLE